LSKQPQSSYCLERLDSAGSVFLVSAIEDWLGLELVSETAIEYPSVALPAHFVAGRLAVKAGGVA
jgi:acyl carrier protein